MTTLEYSKAIRSNCFRILLELFNNDELLCNQFLMNLAKNSNMTFAEVILYYDGIINNKFYEDILLTRTLLNTLVQAEFEGRIYEIKYDTSRLSQSQQGIIKVYIEILKSRVSNPDNIVTRPFRGVKKNYIIKVICKDAHKQLIGEGQVDVAGEDKLGIYPLRIIGMLNIAFAASNIPNYLGQIDEYKPMIKFIQNQYRDITGEELELPDSVEGMLAVIKKIDLPEPEKMDLDEADRLNKLAELLLDAAA